MNGRSAKRIRELEQRNKALEIQCGLLIKAMDEERLRADSAQRGLINYMREHGLADRISPIVLANLNDHYL